MHELKIHDKENTYKVNGFARNHVEPVKLELCY